MWQRRNLRAFHWHLPSNASGRKGTIWVFNRVKVLSSLDSQVPLSIFVATSTRDIPEEKRKLQSQRIQRTQKNEIENRDSTSKAMSSNKLQVLTDRERKAMAINARAHKDVEMHMKEAPVKDSSGRSNNRWSYKALVFPTAFYTFLVPTRCAKEPYTTK